MRYLLKGDPVFSFSKNYKPQCSVLMVCMANICRSPTAEAVLKQRLKATNVRVKVDSAGTLNYRKGTRPDSRSVKAGLARGYNLSKIRSRMITPQDFETFDFILAMDKDNLIELQAKCPPQYQSKLGLLLSYGNGNELEVPDPYYGGSKGFEMVLDLIESATEGLVGEITARHRCWS
ncbi:MAG: low molecular weight phosphotyrosine protein phosphatase [Gammaproteobacteria bacterium]|nr:low molecular weight phosphotyrosine protein phosphatase [Gammaproteobacteria bacterium]